MNPWGQIRNDSEDPVLKTFNQFQFFEKARIDSFELPYRRNQAYWDELKKIQIESNIDVNDFSEYLVNKKQCYKSKAKALSLSKKNVTKTNTKSSSKIDNTQHRENQGAGRQTRKMLEEYDVLMSTQMNDEADYLENEIIKPFTAQLLGIENELNLLWLRGDKLLIATRISDLRAKRNFSIYTALMPVQNGVKSSQSTEAGDSDIWLAEISYSVSAARSYEIKDESNKQLRFANC